MSCATSSSVTAPKSSRGTQDLHYKANSTSFFFYSPTVANVANFSQKGNGGGGEQQGRGRCSPSLLIDGKVEDDLQRNWCCWTRPSFPSEQNAAFAFVARLVAMEAIQNSKAVVPVFQTFLSIRQSAFCCGLVYNELSHCLWGEKASSSCYTHLI